MERNELKTKPTSEAASASQASSLPDSPLSNPGHDVCVMDKMSSAKFREGQLSEVPMEQNNQSSSSRRDAEMVAKAEVVDAGASSYRLISAQSNETSRTSKLSNVSQIPVPLLNVKSQSAVHSTAVLNNMINQNRYCSFCATYRFLHVIITYMYLFIRHLLSFSKMPKHCFLKHV